jgi:hypothetical protein
MPIVSGSYFSLDVPSGTTDESTYAYALPARANFRPSIVVKTERLAEPTPLGTYVQQQLEKIKGVLPNVEIVSVTPPGQGEPPAYTSVYDFGDATQRVRQKQRYMVLDDQVRIVTMTATCLRDTFAQTEAMFDAIFRSFKPLARTTR